MEFKEEPGRYFVGRVRALRELVLWLTRPEAGGLLVVTGDPGSGKSAVLGRLWALSDPRTRREVAAGDVPEGTSPPERCIDVAIHAKDRALEDVVSTIADTIGTRATTAEELIQAVIKRDRALVVMVDALDEAKGEGEARKIASRLLRPLAERAGRQGVRVLVGSRRGPRDELLRVLVGGPRGPGDELLERIGVRGRAIDLDTERYFELDDLIEYAHKRLLGADDRDADLPYRAQPDEVTRRVARAIAQCATPSFLVAQLVSRTVADKQQVVDITRPGWEEFPTTLDSAMEGYLDRFEAEGDRRRAKDLLIALAYAEGVGFPHDHDQDLWAPVASAIAGVRYSADDVDWIVRTAAADLVDRTLLDGVNTWRLFHQAAAEYLRAQAVVGSPHGVGEPERQPQGRIFAALERCVPDLADGTGKDRLRAPSYIRVNLARHAVVASGLDRLMEDPRYLVAADPRQLLRELTNATSARAHDARRSYLIAARRLLLSATPDERAAYLELAARQTGATALADAFAHTHPTRPWSVQWTHWRQPHAYMIAGRHDGEVWGVAVGEREGRPVIVSGGQDGTVRVWDLADGSPIGDPLTGHDRHVRGVAVGEREGAR